MPIQEDKAATHTSFFTSFLSPVVSVKNDGTKLGRE